MSGFRLRLPAAVVVWQAQTPESLAEVPFPSICTFIAPEEYTFSTGSLCIFLENAGLPNA